MLRTRIIGALIVAILVEANIAVPAIQEDVVFYNDAVVTSDQQYRSVTIYDSPPETTTIEFYGQGGCLTMYDSSTLNLLEGAMFLYTNTNAPRWNRLYDSSTLNVYEGALIGGGSGAGIDLYDSSTLNIYGGWVSLFLGTHDSSTFNLYGGILGLIWYIGDNSILNVYAGYVSPCVGDIKVEQTATVNIYGYGFEYNPYGKWELPIPEGEDGRWVSKLTGYGFEGDPITIWGLPDPATHENINLIPEPMTFLLLGLGGLALLKKPGNKLVRKKTPQQEPPA
jgi:hypothetical protein